MIAVRRLTRENLESLLEPYGCHVVESVNEIADIWETGWGELFTLSHDDGYYDYWQYQQVQADIIAVTMPDDWVLEGL